MTRLYTDHYFHIGNRHLTSGKPCQDYAISSVYNDIAFAIVSDGCSTGGNTDVGSRILALSSATAVREHWAINRDALGEFVPQEVMLRQKIVLAGTRQALGLHPHDMLATCVYAYISPSGGFAHIQGDGVVALKYRDGSMDMFNFEWENNMPYYPAYNEDDLANFIKAHGNDLEGLRLSEKKCFMGTDGNFFESDVKTYTLSNGIRGVVINISKDLLLKELEFIAVFSDGVAQIDQMRWEDVVAMFMAFKNTTGEFAKRRMIRGIKDVQKVGKGPIDDISYAVIRVEQTMAEEV